MKFKEKGKIDLAEIRNGIYGRTDMAEEGRCTEDGERKLHCF